MRVLKLQMLSLMLATGVSPLSGSKFKDYEEFHSRKLMTSFNSDEEFVTHCVNGLLVPENINDDKLFDQEVAGYMSQVSGKSYSFSALPPSIQIYFFQTIGKQNGSYLDFNHCCDGDPNIVVGKVREYCTAVTAASIKNGFIEISGGGGGGDNGGATPSDTPAPVESPSTSSPTFLPVAPATPSPIDESPATPAPTDESPATPAPTESLSTENPATSAPANKATPSPTFGNISPTTPAPVSNVTQVPTVSGSSVPASIMPSSFPSTALEETSSPAAAASSTTPTLYPTVPNVDTISPGPTVFSSYDSSSTPSPIVSSSSMEPSVSTSSKSSGSSFPSFSESGSTNVPSTNSTIVPDTPAPTAFAPITKPTALPVPTTDAPTAPTPNTPAPIQENTDAPTIFPPDETASPSITKSNNPSLRPTQKGGGGGASKKKNQSTRTRDIIIGILVPLGFFVCVDCIFGIGCIRRGPLKKGKNAPDDEEERVLPLDGDDHNYRPTKYISPISSQNITEELGREEKQFLDQHGHQVNQVRTRDFNAELEEAIESGNWATIPFLTEQASSNRLSKQAVAPIGGSSITRNLVPPPDFDGGNATRRISSSTLPSNIAVEATTVKESNNTPLVPLFNKSLQSIAETGGTGDSAAESNSIRAGTSAASASEHSSTIRMTMKRIEPISSIHGAVDYSHNEVEEEPFTAGIGKSNSTEYSINKNNNNRKKEVDETKESSSETDNSAFKRLSLSFEENVEEKDHHHYPNNEEDLMLLRKKLDEEIMAWKNVETGYQIPENVGGDFVVVEGEENYNNPNTTTDSAIPISPITPMSNMNDEDVYHKLPSRSGSVLRDDSKVDDDHDLMYESYNTISNSMTMESGSNQQTSSPQSPLLVRRKIIQLLDELGEDDAEEMLSRYQGEEETLLDVLMSWKAKKTAEMSY